MTSYRQAVERIIRSHGAEDPRITAVNVLNAVSDLIVECDDCGGHGADGCDACDATGVRGGGKCRTCQPPGSGERTCPTCWGRGYVVNESAW